MVVPSQTLSPPLLPMPRLAVPACKRTFTPGPEALRNKTYPLRTILSALSDYHVGYTLDEVGARLQPRRLTINHPILVTGLCPVLQLPQTPRQSSYALSSHAHNPVDQAISSSDYSLRIIVRNLNCSEPDYSTTNERVTNALPALLTFSNIFLAAAHTKSLHARKTPTAGPPRLALL